jgi:hypothetical protein
MMSGILRGEKRRNVTFNLDDEQDRARYELSKKINFSKFVKMCMDYELKRREHLNTTQKNSTLHNAR